MKVRSSVKPICEKCKIIKRKGSIRVICSGLRLNTGIEHLMSAEREFSEKAHPET